MFSVCINMNIKETKKAVPHTKHSLFWLKQLRRVISNCIFAFLMITTSKRHWRQVELRVWWYLHLPRRHRWRTKWANQYGHFLFQVSNVFSDKMLQQVLTQTMVAIVFVAVVGVLLICIFIRRKMREKRLQKELVFNYESKAGDSSNETRVILKQINYDYMSLYATDKKSSISYYTTSL